MKRFWLFWFRKTKQEKMYIEACKKAYKKKLFTICSKDEIHSIYLGGSLLRRDLSENSDIDFSSLHLLHVLVSM